MFQRIFAIIQKEFAQTLRDRSTLAIILAIPIVQLILFGYAINMNVRHIPTVVVNQSMDSSSRDFLSALVNSDFFDIVKNVPDQASAVQEIDAGRAQTAVIIPPNFSEHNQRGDSQVLILVDGSDLFTSQQAFNAANSIGQSYTASVIMQSIGSSNAFNALVTHIRILYNPDMKDLWFIIPGMAAMILQTQTIVLTASTIVREREAGTIEQILVSPIRPFELMIGKISVNVLIAIINMLTVIALGVFWFKVPFQGSFYLFIALVGLYVFSGLGLGLLISTVSQNQRQAQQLIMLFTMVGMVLGGFIFPRYTMPTLIRWIGNIFPLTFFVPISRGIITKGIGLREVSTDVIALAVYVVIVLFLSTRAFRERLD
jgi:ABC-2 type transport system permease protein